MDDILTLLIALAQIGLGAWCLIEMFCYYF